MSFKTYVGERIDVQFNADRCIHAAECVKGLPEVFDVNKRPWITPDDENADEVARIVERCPSGALQYVRKDEAENERPVYPTMIKADAKGKLFIRGDIEIDSAEENIHTHRAILCGCGQTKHRPFCDNSDTCK